jgi:hypothetical protein
MGCICKSFQTQGWLRPFPKPTSKRVIPNRVDGEGPHGRSCAFALDFASSPDRRPFFVCVIEFAVERSALLPDRDPGLRGSDDHVLHGWVPDLLKFRLRIPPEKRLFPFNLNPEKLDG